MKTSIKGEIKKSLSINTKLLIFEYKEKFPSLSPEELSEIFSTDIKSIVRLFKEEFLIIPSKLNKK